ncbi:hypothetical protein IKA92_00360 [bacterium]|nr:hypothetical protein [bacterium]
MEVAFQIVVSTIFFLLILFSCTLFTNAIEHLGRVLNIGECAVGSVFAAIGTALPETIVPLVAIVGGFLTGNIEKGAEIGAGAALGSPFMLSTITFFMIFLACIGFYLLKKRKKLGIQIETKFFSRDLKYFIFCYSLAVLAGVLDVPYFKYFCVFVLILTYIFYFKRTIEKAGCSECEQISDLKFAKLLAFLKNEKIIIWMQILFSIFLLIISSHFLVLKIQYFSEIFNINPFLLSLIVMPFATELPETVNSVLWIREDKDTLAISNISGALVFQSCIPLSIAITLTQWKFDNLAILNILFVLLMSISLFLVSKVIKKIPLGLLAVGGIFYLIFILAIV